MGGDDRAQGRRVSVESQRASGFVGDFAPEELLWETPGRTLHAARAPLSDRCGHALKRVSADPLLAGDGDTQARRLLDSAAVQRRCAEANPDSWAAVHDAGELGDGEAYAVTDLLPRSAGELIRLQIHLRPAVLARIVGGVVRGLITLRDACDGRAHGALSPENVLVRGDEPSSWTGVLTDPLGGDLLPGDAERGLAADLRALGRLIALLVTHRDARGGKISGSDESWSRLGRVGPAWRELCAELLAADDAGDLDELRERVSALRRRAERPKKQRRAGAAVTLLLAIGLGVFLVFGTGGDPTKGGSTRAPFEEEPFRAWCADAELWVLYLERDAQTRREDLARDAHLAGELLPVLDEATQREIELDPRSLVRASPRSRLRLVDMVEPDERNQKLGGRTTEALDIIGRLRGAISSWDALGGASERAAVYARRGWRPQGAFLDQLSQRVLAPDWTDPATGLVTVPESIDETFGPELVENLVQLSEASVLCDEIDAAWERTQARIEPIRDGAAPAGEGDEPDPLLAAFGDLPDRYTAFRGLGGDIEALRTLHARVMDLDAISGSIETFVGDGWARVDRPFFVSQSQTLAAVDPESPARIEDFRAWLGEASDPGVTKLEPESDPRLAYGGSAAFEPLPGEIETLRDRYGAELFEELLGESDLAERTPAALRAARELDTIRWQRLTQEEVEDGARRLGAELARTSEEVTRLGEDLLQTATAYLDELRESEGVSAFSTPSIDAAWRSMRDDLLARYAEDGRFADLRRAEAPARARLLDIERRLRVEAEFESAPRGFDPEMIEPVLAERMDAAGGAGAALLSWNGRAYETPAGFEQSLASIAAADRAWVERLVELVNDHARVEQSLDSAMLLDEAGDDGRSARELVLAWRPSEELGDERIHNSLAGVLGRVAHVESIERETDAQRLVAWASDDGQETVAALTAYLGIGEADAAWPASVDQLETERLMMRGLEDRAQGLASLDRQAAVGSRVRNAARARWARFADGADELREVDAAAGAREAFGADLGGLSPRSAYNVLLREFQTGVDLSMDESALRTRVERLRDEMRPLAPGLRDPGAQRFIDEVADIARPPDDTRRVLEAREFGPGRHGWSASDVDGGEVLVYTSSGVGGAMRLEFVRIEPDSSNGLRLPAYVSKSEVSLGVVRAMGARLGGWDGVAEQWLALADSRERAGQPGGQEWAGARVWSWDPAARAMVPGESWLKRHPQMTAEAPAYAPGLGDPSDPLLIAPGQGRPGDAMPMNHVSARAAQMLGEALGARVPTEAEFRAAVRKQGGGGQAVGGGNRRDATFARQRDWITRVEATLLQDGAVSQFSYPDRGVFLPREVSASTDGNATAMPTDDGVLWFTPVDAGGGGPFRDLIGNVAEFVSVEDGFGVIGASALSAPEIDPMTLYKLRRAQYKRGANSDVGFRLALDVPEGVFRQTVNRRMEKLLARASCVFE